MSATYYFDYSGDSDLTGTILSTYLGDSSILKVIAASLTANATIVPRTIDVTFTSDANLVTTILSALTYVGDSAILKVIASSYSVDANILAIISDSYTGNSFITSLSPLADIIETNDDRDMGAKKSIVRIKMAGTIPDTFRTVEELFRINMMAKQLVLDIPSLGGATLTAELLDASGIIVWSKAIISESQTITYLLPDTTNVGVLLVNNNTLRLTTSADVSEDTLISALLYGI